MERAMTGEPVSLGVGLAVTTVGRPALQRLLDSAADSSQPPVAVAVANQSRRALRIRTSEYDFPVRIVASTGGASIGRNDAVTALGDVVTRGAIDVLGFPNDDSVYPPETLAQVAAAFKVVDPPDALAVSLAEVGGPRFVLPPEGQALTKLSVWRAIEPAMFCRYDTFIKVHGFRPDLGTGAASPWQSGEGTDLLLRFIASGGRVNSAPSIEVRGTGERRELTDEALIRKHHGYARGTGFVYRSHAYSPYARATIVLAPWVRALQGNERLSMLTWRLAWARSFGRLEGTLGRTLVDLH
jgi:hypothetical protein